MLDISQMCRVCRDESDCLLDLFTKMSAPNRDQEPEPHLAIMLKECSGCNIARSDGMPQFICVECAEATRNAFRLRRQCRKSHIYFEQLRLMIEELDGIEACLNVENATDPNKQETSGEAETFEPKALEPLFVELVELKYKTILSPKKLQPPANIKENKSSSEEKIADRPSRIRKRARSSLDSWSPNSDFGQDNDENWEASKKKKTKKAQRALQCFYCDHSFDQRKHLEIHMRVHTGERPFQCSLCPRSFTQKGNLNTHFRCHTGERPFKCPHCPKRFRQIGQVHVHIRVHTGERPFRCSICRYRFKQKVNLQKHMLTHTEVKVQPKSHGADQDVA
ncbi:zinc finger protein 1 homolog [Drosophila ficusphila]|uniref:zinc finger protein 1 homolog n=1 Tax=Drosophila ficusphila TaxID=30025 RepID=UPI0007E676FC|nr:zinc finger protein 1 homolog [Drosophila ficusphila]